MDKQTIKIQKQLFGHEITTEMNIILTPLNNIYEKIHKEFKDYILEYGGMYKCFSINNRIMVIKCPQGIQAQDAIVTLQEKNILFAGFAGSLGDFKIGDVIGVESAILPTGERINLHTYNTLEQGVCGYSPALLGEVAKIYQKQALENGCNLVDMEISYCAKCAYSQKNLISAIMLITDQPNIIEFWQLEKKSLEAFCRGEKEFLRLIFGYVRGLVR